MFREKGFLHFSSIEFLDNKHRCTKVMDVIWQICWFIAMCHLLKCFLPKFHIFKFQIRNWNLVAYYLSTCLFGSFGHLIWFTCLLNVRFIYILCNSFWIFYNRHRPMINLKESTFINETIRHLKYKTLKYIKGDPYVHPNWICNTIYTLPLILFQKYAFTWILWFNNSIRQHDVLSYNVVEN